MYTTRKVTKAQETQGTASMAKETDAATPTPRYEAHRHEDSHELYDPPEQAYARRESLYQAHETHKDAELQHLTRTEFQELLKDPDNFYKEINKLITDVNTLRAHRQNYQE
jgi:hypothetical protein